MSSGVTGKVFEVHYSIFPADHHSSLAEPGNDEQQCVMPGLSVCFSYTTFMEEMKWVFDQSRSLYITQ
ncbi:hypothetical protein JZ751_007536 [Albula glossodonta]|uniref:Uncharacterized protein n=1 Tax=Albula glossodonta TaxID=121402 RepID=A0A8T2NDH8_9TELE|nr:hypothetical protein JZ751_007536 [Albula glossodonta]